MVNAGRSGLLSLHLERDLLDASENRMNPLYGSLRDIGLFVSVYEKRSFTLAAQ